MRRHNVTTINYHTNLRCYYEVYGGLKLVAGFRYRLLFSVFGFRFSHNNDATSCDACASFICFSKFVYFVTLAMPLSIYIKRVELTFFNCNLRPLTLSFKASSHNLGSQAIWSYTL